MATERERLHNLFPDLDFDPEALRARYRQERDKRLREDGEDQYLEAANEHAHFADHDPERDLAPDHDLLDVLDRGVALGEDGHQAGVDAGAVGPNHS